MTATKDNILSAKQKKVIDAVNKKFDDSKIKQRQGQGGRTFDYVQSQEYIAKLNEIFGVAWSSEIIQHFLVDNQVVMWVRVTHPNPDNPDQLFSSDGVDGHPLSKDVGNAFKAAYLKAFRKAAAQIGLGLHLWGVEFTEDDDAPVWDQGVPPGPPPNAQVMTPVASPTVPNTTGPVPTNPGTPPQQHNAGPPVPPGRGGPPQPPQMYNNNPPVDQGPPSGHYNGPVLLPPVPTGNPNPTGGNPPPPGPPPNPGQNVGYSAPQSDGTRGPATASVGIQSNGNQQGNGGAAGFQINGIRGAAVALGTNELDLTKSILGQVADNITSLDQLTEAQAQHVMDQARQMTQGR